MTGKLEILKAPKGSQKGVLIDGPITIGRASDNDVIIRDRRVSRYHCVLEPASGGIQVRDVGSSLGTYVNRKRVTEQLLRDGDRISLGKSRLLYVAQVATADCNGVAAPDHNNGVNELIRVAEAEDSAAPLVIDPEDSALPIDDEPAADIPIDNDEADVHGSLHALDSEDSNQLVEGVLNANDSSLVLDADDADNVEPAANPESITLLPVSDALSDSSAFTTEPADEVNASIASDENAHHDELKAAETRAAELQVSLEAAESRAAELLVSLQEAEARATQATEECTALRAEHASSEGELDRIRDRTDEYERALSFAEEQFAIVKNEVAAAHVQNIESVEALKTDLAEAKAETLSLCEALAESEHVSEDQTQELDMQERRLEAAQAQHEQVESDLQQKLADATGAAADRMAEAEGLAEELARLRRQIDGLTDETAREVVDHADRVAVLEVEVSGLRQAAKTHKRQLVELEETVGSERARVEQIASEREALDKARHKAESTVAGLQTEMEQLQLALQGREEVAADLRVHVESVRNTADEATTRCEQRERELKAAKTKLDELKVKEAASQVTESAHASRRAELEREVEALQEEREGAAESHQLLLDQREQRIDELEREVYGLLKEREGAAESQQLSLDQREQRIDELEREMTALRETIADQHEEAMELPYIDDDHKQLELVTVVAAPAGQHAESEESQLEVTRASESAPAKRLPRNYEDLDLMAWIAIGMLVIALLALGGFSLIRLFLT